MDIILHTNYFELLQTACYYYSFQCLLRKFSKFKGKLLFSIEIEQLYLK